MEKQKLFPIPDLINYLCTLKQYGPVSLDMLLHKPMKPVAKYPVHRGTEPQKAAGIKMDTIF